MLETSAACWRCGKVQRVVTRYVSGPVLAAHKCPHGSKCSDAGGCPLCGAVPDVKPEILAPPCVWCSPLGVADGARGDGCVACCRIYSNRGTVPADHDLLRDLRAGVVSVWKDCQ